jgi:hippurate hydrolase
MAGNDGALNDYLARRGEEFRAWRRALHAEPELAFNEHKTAAFVAERLRAHDIEVHEGVSGTGVVGVLRRGRSNRAIALRADMDALPIEELNTFPHRSKAPGVMHACGHDGHTTMLLAAAGFLAQHGRFDGTVTFLFQPAEENVAGASVMVRDGFFQRFPVDSIYGLHNRPQLPFGTFALRRGPMMASADNFGVTIRGHGGHGGSPHLTVDGAVIAAELILALQTIVSRHTDPLDSAVISVTQMSAGKSDNVIAEIVHLRGTVRSLRVTTQDRIESMMRKMAENVSGMHGATAVVDYERRYPPVTNDAAEAEFCAAVAAGLVGDENVTLDAVPSMGSDDFSFFGRERPSAFMWMGTGPVEAGRYLHNPLYDFNDDAIPLGVSYWVKLVEKVFAIG